MEHREAAPRKLPTPLAIVGVLAVAIELIGMRAGDPCRYGEVLETGLLLAGLLGYMAVFFSLVMWAFRGLIVRVLSIPIIVIAAGVAVLVGTAYISGFDWFCI